MFFQHLCVLQVIEQQSFELFPLILRWHQNMGEKRFSKPTKSLRQAAPAPRLSPQHASPSRLHRPQAAPRLPQTRPPSSPDDGPGILDLDPFLTTGSSFPGSTPFQRKSQNCTLKEGQKTRRCLKTSAITTPLGMERAPTSAA